MIILEFPYFNHNAKLYIKNYFLQEFYLNELHYILYFLIIKSHLKELKIFQFLFKI